MLQQEIWASPARTPTPEQADEVLRWYRKAERIREQIAETNLALVLAMAKRTRMSEVDFADLVSEGNMALLRAVDKFDAGRGFKFSTYACRAILKAFSRQGMKLSKYRQRFPTDFDPKLEKSNHLETKRGDFESDTADEVKRIVLENAADLTDVERTVIEHRFGLEPGRLEKPMTLEQVGSDHRRDQGARPPDPEQGDGEDPRRARGELPRQRPGRIGRGAAGPPGSAPPEPG
jgi:RNA polymerase primary sigma factor